ncbi:MAG: GIY-YIG nuclease family protein [Rhodospirillales bacterium]|nr:GIY-YIG nuclease family protein [Rhodospirillales bacterium]
MDSGNEKMNEDVRQGHPSGFVYILSNQAFEGLLKIGETSISPYQRAKELQGTGVPRPFIVERAFYVKDRQASERIVHEALAIHRLEDNREFFETSVENAISVATAVLRQQEQIDDKVWPDTDREAELKEELSKNIQTTKSLNNQFDTVKAELNDFKQMYSVANMTIEDMSKTAESYKLNSVTRDRMLRGIKSWCENNPNEKAIVVVQKIGNADFS